MHREARIHLNLPADRARAGIFDLELPPGLTDQRMRVLLSGAELRRLDLVSRRRRYRVEFPRDLQQKGLNELALLFDRASPRVEANGRRVSAALRSLAIGVVGDTAFESLLDPESPPPLSLLATGEKRSIVQAGPSELTYAFAAPRGGEVRVRPRVHPDSNRDGKPLRFAIAVESEGRPAREIWYREIVPGEEVGDVRASLGVAAGTPVVLSLRVGGATSGAAWGIWETPRVLGRDRPAPAVAPATIPAVDRHAAPLREKLRGVNVLLIVLDAAGARHFGCYGYPRATTPEIDAIAREGVTFDSVYTTGCYTRAAMGSVWTSQFPDDHGAVGELSRLPAAPFPTLAEILTSHGIHTAGFVANSVAGLAFGMDRGFAEFREVYREVGIDADAFHKTLAPWLGTNTRRPFFAYAHFREPHFPYDPPEAFANRFGSDGPISPSIRRDRDWVFGANDGTKPLSAAQADHLVRLYDGSLAFADHEIGALREALEAADLWEKTAVIITADHGEALYEHQFIMHNQQLYEDSVRIPLILRLPSVTGIRGRRVAGLVDSTDIAPTIADILGVPERPPAGFRGRSLLPAILGAPGKPFAFSRSLGERPLFSLRDDRYTFILDSRGGREELYDRGSDPGETRNRIGQEPVRAARYRQVLWTWMAGLARRQGAETGDASLATDQRENLRSLGYIQ